MVITIKFLFLFLLATTYTVHAKCSKTIRWNNNNLLQLDTVDKQYISSNIKMLEQAVTNLGCQVVFLQMPWGRSLIELKHGRVDIMGGAFKTEERQQFAWYSDFVYDTSLVLFMRSEDIGKYRISSLQDILKNKIKLGTQINTIYSDEFSQLLSDKNFSSLVYPNTSRKALWNMLKIGRIDGFISELQAGLIELQSLGLSSHVRPSDFIVSTQGTHFIFSKQTISYDFVKAVDQELAKLSELHKFDSTNSKEYSVEK